MLLMPQGRDLEEMSEVMEIGTLNAHNGNKNPVETKRFMERSGVHVWGVQESKHLGRVKGYKRLGARFGSHGRRENAIYYKKVKGLRRKGRLSIQKMTEDTGAGVAHDRWNVSQDFVFWGNPFNAIVTHFNAAIYEPSTRKIKNTRGAGQAVSHATRTVQQINSALRRKFPAFTMADFNYPIYAPPNGLPAPQSIAKAVSGRAIGRKIDGIIFDPTFWQLRSVKSHPVVGSPHNAFTAKFRPRNDKKK